MLGSLPLSYTTRGLFVRSTSTILTVVGIAATVAVLAGVLALQQGFARLFAESGREDVAVFMRPGATSEGESAFQIDRADILIKSMPEIATDDAGRPLASAESFLAVRMRKLDGGETNVPIRGVQPATFDMMGDEFRVVEGERFAAGSDEVIIGSGLADRIQGCRLGEVIVMNTTPFRVVGVFEHDGPFASEIWGDVDRMMEALERRSYSRVIARLAPETDLEGLRERLESDKQVPATVMTEREYLTSQTQILSGILIGLGSFLAVVMGSAAVFTGTNTMLAALSARTHEIGVLLSIGFRPFWIFVAFMLEATLLGLLGGVLGALVVIPLNGIRTGTTNFQTFTEVAFAFQVTPFVLLFAVGTAMILGILGGAWPAWRAARMDPTDALRHG